MRQLMVVETYRIDTETEVQAFIEQAKKNANTGGYILNSYSSQLREKKAKGDVIDAGYLVKLTKTYDAFWD